MPVISRRRLLAHAAGTAAVGAFPRLLNSAVPSNPDPSRPVPFEVDVTWDRAVATIPGDLLGLSYESTQLGSPDFFSAMNTQLISLFRRLYPNGILRLGGNLSEYTVWSPKAKPATTEVSFQGVGADPGKKLPPHAVPICPQAIHTLNDFLNLTKWRVVYGLNLALADPERAASEAEFVNRVLGAKLIAFQIGNEPDHYSLNEFRPKSYTFPDYFREWRIVHDAVVKRVPKARFAGPDIAVDMEWVRQFAAVAPPSVVSLTGHYYAEGPPVDPTVTLERLLKRNSYFDRRVTEMQAIVAEHDLPYIMAETNSCYNAGKPGVSDVFGSALWALGHTMQLAQAGASGVYFHGGGNGWYTPIAGGSGKDFYERPIYSGLLMAKELQGAKMVAATFPDMNHVCVHAFHDPPRLLVVNKGTDDLLVQLRAPLRVVRVERLQAPAADAQTSITLTKEAASSLAVPRYSAAVFEFAQG